jgi:hypothetical protein
MMQHSTDVLMRPHPAASKVTLHTSFSQEQITLYQADVRLFLQS